MNLGPTRFMSDESHFLLTAVDLPVVSWVAEATEEISCLVLSLKFEHVHGPNGGFHARRLFLAERRLFKDLLFMYRTLVAHVRAGPKFLCLIRRFDSAV